MACERVKVHAEALSPKITRGSIGVAVSQDSRRFIAPEMCRFENFGAMMLSANLLSSRRLNAKTLYVQAISEFRPTTLSSIFRACGLSGGALGKPQTGV